MDFAAVQKQLNDLPGTFKRPDTTYLQLVDSITALLFRFTQGADGTDTQLQFQNSQYGWLDVWGLLMNVIRMLGEADANYMARIAFQVLAGGGPPLQIQKWISVVYRVSATVTENFPSVGYTITFDSAVAAAQAQAIVAGLSYVRPAGVPITAVFVVGVGTVLETVNFLAAPSVVGAYLGGSLILVPISMGATTNNATPIIPTLYLTDPTLNQPTQV